MNKGNDVEFGFYRTQERQLAENFGQNSLFKIDLIFYEKVFHICHFKKFEIPFISKLKS